MWGCPYTDSVSNAFGGRAGFDMDASYILPQSGQEVITLVRGGGQVMK